MSPEGTGSPISAQDAVDLLQKLMMESTKVFALFTATVGRVRASVEGVIRAAPDETFWVIDEDRPRPAMIAFDPALFVVRKYGDERAMLDAGDTPFGVSFHSQLSFVFEDGSTLTVLEFAEAVEERTE
jgi:hypothetical protein